MALKHKTLQHGKRRMWSNMVPLGDPTNPRSTTPESTSKLVKVETGGWGSGLGNNVSNTMRGVNAEPDRMAAELDKTAAERQDYHLRNRRTDAYKIARAEAKRRKRGMFKPPGDASEDGNTTSTKRQTCFLNGAGKVENMSGAPIVRKPTIGAKVDPTMDAWGQRVAAWAEKQR